MARAVSTGNRGRRHRNGARSPRTRPSPVRFLYSGIRVRNLRRSLRFYEAIGFREVKRGRFSHGGTYVHLVFPGSPHRLELNYYPRGSRYYDPALAGDMFDHFGFWAARPSRWLANAIRAGGRKRLAYTDLPPQQLYFVSDPNGVWLGVFGPIEPRGAPTGKPIRRSRTRA
jgi:catechol 2,3-dioxygenase-like lactoylglutathione lyase family enzyme